MWAVERWKMLDDPALDAAERAELERMGKEEDKKLVKPHGRAVLEQTPGPDEQGGSSIERSITLPSVSAGAEQVRQGALTQQVPDFSGV